VRTNPVLGIHLDKAELGYLTRLTLAFLKGVVQPSSSLYHDRRVLEELATE